MSRFFQNVDDSESSDSDFSSSGSEFSEEELQQKPTGGAGNNRFARAGLDLDSDSDDDVKRVVKNPKEKQTEEVVKLSQNILKAIRADEWDDATDNFNKLEASVTKLKKILKGSSLPTVFIRCLVKLEDCTGKDGLSKEQLGKLNAINARAFNKLKQRLRKSIKPYASDMKAYRENPVDSAEEDEKEAESESEDQAERSQRSTPAPQAAAAADDEDDGFTTVGKGGKKVEKPTVSAESLNKSLIEINMARGRKGTDKKETVAKLELLLSVAGNALQQCKVLMALASAQFDESADLSHMPTEKWNAVQSTINRLLEVLEKNHQVSIYETADAHDDDSDIKYSGEPITLRGSVISLVERLDDEFTRSLQNIDPHTPDYIDRMRDSLPLYLTIARAQGYFERAEQEDSLCRIVSRRLAHLYYRTDQVNDQFEATAASLHVSAESKIVPPSVRGNTEATIHGLCTFLYQHADSLLRIRAMLMHVFNHALHKRYYIARDLLLMSHIQENAHQADVSTQILYNRALAQLGLAAFRLGKIREAFDHTMELMSSGHQRELLAQGVGQQRMQQQQTFANEQLQRQRQLPFHININLELLECVFLTASMLIEIPFMASANANPEARRTATCRVFRRMLDFNERQVFLGPPENTRDHIMASAKALADGDWVKSRDYIQAIKIWSLLPDSQEIKDMLASKIQVEALRTYLFTYSTQFEAVGLDDLSAMFELPRNKVYSLLARMVYQDELQASLDEVSGVLVFSPANFEASSRLQQTALMLSNKANQFADINERGNTDQSGRAQGNDRDSRSNFQRSTGVGGNNAGGRDGQRNRNDASGNGSNRNSNSGRNNRRGNNRRGNNRR
ncbi:eukaryotic translation initiation factor 3 subunit 8 N-terminus-domain-containing protein [Coemansia mojavensis]|nr:eukaryotic translation initiation factor 3 subunit 8 N-terminus-domain-containing protein [Coemansia mojavensis]